MRTLLSLAVLAALGGCAIVITPNDGEARHYSALGNVTRGDGQLAAERRPIGNLAGIELSGPIHLDAQLGPTPLLEIEADGNLLPLIHTEAQGNNLRVWVEGNVQSNHPIRVKYTIPQLRHINANGSGKLIATGLDGGPLTVSNNGSGNMQLQGQVDKLDARVNGSGSLNASALQTGSAKVSLQGSGQLSLGQIKGDLLEADVNGSGQLQASGAVQTVNARVFGSGSANLAGLKSQKADLSSYGSGDITLSVSQSLTAQTNGSGEITVYGNPAQRSLNGKRIRILG